MRKLAKKILPARIVDVLRKLKGNQYRNKPRFSSFQRKNPRHVLQCCIAYNKYGGYCVPMSSYWRPAPQRILNGEVWEPDTIEFLISQCGDGDIIHAGTYFGDFLPALSRCCDPRSKVWAFEPNPENYRCASIGIYINCLRNVELKNAGLGAHRGSLSMLILDEAGKSLGGISRLIDASDEIYDERSIAVDIVTVDEIVPADRQVSIVQLDVEGFEKAALIGSLATIRRCKPLIVLEQLPDKDWLSENILDLGYKIVGKVGENSHRNTILSCR
jgi:FkbM family methyltransferase